MVVVKLKSLGVVSKFVGIGFVYDKESGWRLEQRQAILELLEKFGLSSATPVLVPVGGEQEDEAEGELLQSGGAQDAHSSRPCRHSSR
ncbi:hypothetical protein PF005_g690 [Phytophthora fragariae]|uniref:Uncharacterized protein n=1 Tax=Phytophthora fragariae TaxID=53985 RepID=A0A6A4AMA6_9STRA|nr:hypothetical protein PF003_g8396 [Phytophthora fragariae]KAE8950145.1 hypothetical protein PF009_g321 [Phytophthora fragariae]KAE9141341.1 hypothetical protein PF007_g297 [Phytophthora fragariae]KAE9155494.1 hypothetical protein PF006_g544 [Phytophthora fragariae]KAE9237276.1 hypothetical protein PF005_g690 [Phytophthora fragariae]